MRGLRLVAVVMAMAAAMVGCGGARDTSDTSAEKVRPPYGGINLVMDTGGVGTSVQLFLDPGTANYPKSYPIVVANHQDCQGVALWRYDFVQVPAPSDASQALYATLLVRVDESASGYVSFFNRGGSWPVGGYDFNPTTSFSGDVPETPQNKKDSAVFLFLRQGSACRIINPKTLGRIAGYRNLSDETTVSVSIPGLDWPVGGASLSSNSYDASEVGIQSDLTALTQTSSSGSTSSSSSTSSGSSTGTSDYINTPITTVQAERVPTSTLVSPATSEYDLVFAWQSPSAGVVETHAFYADPANVGGGYGTGFYSATGGGFFLTQLPGVPSLSDGTNTLNWTYLRSSTDPIWTLGWSADVSAETGIKLGQSADTFSKVAAGQALVTAQVRGFLAGVMHPSARASMFMGKQDWNFAAGPCMLLEGAKLPLVARTPRATLSGQLGQLVVGGRSFWYRQNSTVLGADVTNGDQTLTSKYGTLVTFAAYLPVEVSK